MAWTVTIAKPAQKQVANFPVKDQKRIGAALSSMANDPFAEGILKLYGEGKSLAAPGSTGSGCVAAGQLIEWCPLMPDENQPNPDPEEPEQEEIYSEPPPPTNVWDAIQDAKVAESLKEIALGVKGVLGAFEQGIRKRVEAEPVVIAAQVKVQLWSFVFAITLFAGVGLLGYLHVLTKGTTATLLGSLIGYWYGRYERDKPQK